MSRLMSIRTLDSREISFKIAACPSCDSIWVVMPFQFSPSRFSTNSLLSFAQFFFGNAAMCAAKFPVAPANFP